MLLTVSLLCADYDRYTSLLKVSFNYVAFTPLRLCLTHDWAPSFPYFQEPSCLTLPHYELHSWLGCVRSWKLEGTLPLTASCSTLQVFQELPMEFAAEVNQLMSLKLEGSVG